MKQTLRFLLTTIMLLSVINTTYALGVENSGGNSMLFAPPTSGQLLIDVTSSNTTPNTNDIITYKFRYRYASTTDHATGAQVELTFPAAFDIVSSPSIGGNVASISDNAGQYILSLASPSSLGLPAGTLSAGSSGIFEFQVKFKCGANGVGDMPAAGTTVNLTQNPVFTVSGVSNTGAAPAAITVPSVNVCPVPTTSTNIAKYPDDQLIGRGTTSFWTLTAPTNPNTYTITESFPSVLKLWSTYPFPAGFTTEVQVNGNWHEITNFADYQTFAASVAIGATLKDQNGIDIVGTTRVNETVLNGKTPQGGSINDRILDYVEGVNSIRFTGSGAWSNFYVFFYTPQDATLGITQNCLTSTSPIGDQVCADFAVTDKGGIEAVCGLYSNGNGALGSGTLNDDVVGDYPNLYVDPMDMQGRAGFAHTVKTGSIEAPTVEVLLPLGFDFIEGTTKPNFWVVKDEYVINNAPSAVVPVFSRVSNYNGTGQVLLKWDFPNLTLPAFGPSNNTTYDHIVEIKINYSARYMATHPLANSISTNTTVRTQNIIAFTGQVRDGLGNPCQEQSCSDSVSIPPNSGSVNSEKYVKGALDVAQSRYPVTGNTELSGDATYEIYVYNHNTENLKQIDIADILPYIGDKDMLSTSNRGSGWSEELTSAITVERFKIGSGLVDASPEVPNGVLYSNTYNACYLDGALPVGQLTASPALASVGQSAGCTDFSGAVAPSGAKGFAFQWTNIADPLIFGEYLKVTVNVTQLNGEADRINNEVAWNSFAFTVVEEDDDVLFSSEPLKVGVKMIDVSSKAALGGKVWNDANANGRRENGEQVFQGITVSLYDDTGNPITESVTINGVTSNVPVTAITDALGDYSFYGLIPNTAYSVRLENENNFTASGLLDGLILTTSNAPAVLDTEDSDGVEGVLVGSPVTPRPQITLSTGAADTTIIYNDFGFYALASVGNYVWLDDDEEGDQDAGESPVQGVLMELYTTDNTLIDSQTTNSSGYYLFENLLPNTYYIKANNLPAGKIITNKNATGNSENDSDFSSGANVITDNFTLNSGQSRGDIDLGLKDELLDPAAICGIVWDDFNEDGVIDGGEPVLSNITVNLLDASNFVINSIQTGVNGDYCFNNLTPNTDYKVAFVLPTPTTTFTNPGADMDADPTTGITIIYTPTNNQTITDVDAGIIGNFSIGNLVWSDDNLNGIRDNNEAPYSNVEVYLLDGTGTNYLAQTTTDANGRYVFKNLVQGAYKVEIELPADTRSSSDPINAANPNASDNDDNGIGIASSGRVQSQTITLQQGGGVNTGANWTESDDGEVINGEYDATSNPKAYYTIDFGVIYTAPGTCEVADNTTTTASITEGETKTLTGTPVGGTWSIVSGGGTIAGTIYTPADINTNTDVTIRYTIAAAGPCIETTHDVTFTVTPVCLVADNTTTTASITEGQTKTLTGTPVGGTWSIVSGGGTIAGTIYTPADINTNTDVTIRYTIAADGSCIETTDDVTFTVTPICLVADNTTTTASITEGQTKTLTGTPVGGTWSIVSGGGTIAGTIYTPADINTNTDVTIRYTIAADGSCIETTDDVTFTVTPICLVADNTTTTASITEGQTKTLTGTPVGGTWSIVSGGGTIAGTIYTPADINTNTDVTIRYTIAADGSCIETTDDVTFTVTPICLVADNTTTTASITEGQTKTLTGTPVGGTWSIVSGGGTIAGTIYTPADINTNTDVTIRYTIAADGSCIETTDDVTFTVTPICLVADNTTTTASITEGQTKTLTGTPVGGTWSIVSGGGTIAGTIYTPANININTDVTIRYTIAADGSCIETTDDVTFTVTPVIICLVAANTTTTASITEGQTKTLTGAPAGGTWSIVSGGGTIAGTIYTPADINTNTDVTIRYTIAAAGPCAETTDDVTFTVTPICLVADNTTTTASITEGDTKTLTGTPVGGTWSIVSGGGTIAGTIYTPADINTNTDVTIRYTIAADGSCIETTDDVTFTVTPICLVADNTTTTASITEGDTKTLTGTPVGGTWSIVSGGGTIAGTIYTPADINTNTDVTIRYSIAADGSCAETTDDVTFTVTPICLVADNTTTTASITEGQTKTLSGAPAGGTWSIVSGGGNINGTTYTPDDINVNTDVTIRYTIAADGSCAATTEDVTFTVTPVCDVVADNTTATASITEGQTKTLSGAPAGGTWSIVSGGGTINGTIYTPADINVNTDVTIRYTIAADGSCAATSEDVTFTVTPVISLGSIGDTVWYDTDGDGIKDVGENGLEGATVTLDPGTPGNPNDDIVTTTDANGNYLFNNLLAGNYTVSVDVSTVTGGLPPGIALANLVQTFDADGVGTPNTSSLTLASGENNLEQDFAFIAPSGGTSGGNSGGVESESLGDAISKIYVGRKKNSAPTEFVKSSANLYNKKKMKSAQPYQGKGQTLLDMFPTELVSGNVANVTSPTDILDYTIADEVLSVDFSIDGKTKGVVLGIKTSDKIYNHTKASCDRLRGAEILNIQKVQLKGYNFLMQGIKQRNGIVEYAISFATAKNNNDTNYSIQTNWYVNNYTKFNDVYNFQVWSTKPADTQKMVVDILDNLQSFIPVNQTEVQKFPETYASKIYRDKGELVVNLRSTQVGNTAEVSMTELYSETANNIKHRYNSLNTEIQQALRLDIADGYEYDGLVKVDDEVEDAFYHADGNWGLDYDKNYTEILNYFVWNDFDRTYQDDEYTINRNVEIKATSEYDYLTVYKSLLPGTLSADYSEYKYLSFTAKGSGLMELGLIKSSVENWKEQYRLMVDLSEEEQTYYIPFEYFSSTGTTDKLTADDLTTIAFTFLPVEANTKELDLFISNVKFTKTAIEDQTIAKIETFENNFMAYPNPSQGNVNVLLFSKIDATATVSLYDVTGKEIYSAPTKLTAGKNEIDFNVKVKSGIMFLKVTSKQVNYGTSKILFR